MCTGPPEGHRRDDWGEAAAPTVSAVESGGRQSVEPELFEVDDDGVDDDVVEDDELADDSDFVLDESDDEEDSDGDDVDEDLDLPPPRLSVL